MKRKIRTCLLAAMFVAAVPTISFAQLVAAKDGPVVYGHHHLNVTSVEDHQKFWVDTLGGVPAKLGPMDIVKFPNVFMIFTPHNYPSSSRHGCAMSICSVDPMR